MLEKYGCMSQIILVSSQRKCVRILLCSGQRQGEWLPATLRHLEPEAALLVPTVRQSYSWTAPFWCIEFSQFSVEFHQFKTSTSPTAGAQTQCNGAIKGKPISFLFSCMTLSPGPYLPAQSLCRSAIQ